MKLMTKVNQKRIKVKGNGVNGSTKFDKEIKKIRVDNQGAWEP